jgi:hypothetical protein
MNEQDKPSASMPDTFDRVLGQTQGLPNSTHTKDTIIRTVPPLGIGGTHVWVVRTYRQRDPDNPKVAAKDTIFLERHGSDNPVRVVVPPEVVNVFMRQHDALSTKSRRVAGKERARRDKIEGRKPGFKMTKAEREAAAKKKKEAK